MPPIPLTFSIANGLAFGITAYALIKLARGRIGRTGWLLLVLSALFVALRLAVDGVIAGRGGEAYRLLGEAQKKAGTKARPHRL